VAHVGAVREMSRAWRRRGVPVRYDEVVVDSDLLCELVEEKDESTILLARLRAAPCKHRVEVGNPDDARR